MTTRPDRADDHPPLLASPPPEVLAEVDAAWARSGALFDGGFVLRFATQPGTGRVFAEGGRTGATPLRYSATEVLALACGR